MCGLIGITASFEPQARADLSLLATAREKLASAESFEDPRAAARLVDAIAIEVEPAVAAMCAWPGFQVLWTDPDARQDAKRLAERFEACAKKLDTELAQGPAGTDGELADVLRTVEQARDLAWRIEKDALANLVKVARLIEHGAPEAKFVFELWRLNAILNQLERLEVRGRDSSGIGTLVHLSPEGLAAFELAAHHLGLDEEIARRRARPDFKDGSIILSRGAMGFTLAFSHKVASEVGELGANVRRLRARVAEDQPYRLALCLEEAHVQVIAHTRWASNGVVSEPNCHPLSNEVIHGIASGAVLGERSKRTVPRVVLGALNGDVDNAPELAALHAAGTGRPIPPTITTDAKLVPVEVDRRQIGDEPGAFERAFAEAIDAFDGSVAVASIASSAPGTYALALRGSGQAIYVGVLPGGGAVFASELYGLVELSTEHFKLEGRPGEILFLDESPTGTMIRSTTGESLPILTRSRKRATISTRDIDRRGFEHYLAKEIADAPGSVRKTLQGKFSIGAEGVVRFKLDAVITPGMQAALADGSIDRIFVIGQGTACVAARAVADLIESLFEETRVHVRGMPATELSGAADVKPGPGTIVVAVSQSGTTADTNRAVDLARSAGAHVIAIVNRRGSDLADKSHGVFYTSDGRDIEMSVASTKAFYSQVTAGYILGLALAEAALVLDMGRGRKGSPRTVEAIQLLRELTDLPRRMEELLATAQDRIRAAAQLALPRRHWAVVGSGPLRFAAEEVRIKLSELCYKSVALDTIEDKKHIDLSSEPFVVVCAAGLSGSMAADAVKEIAIHRAHRGAPVVICEHGDARFAEYAMATIEVPRASARIALLLDALAGHLLAYECARSIDRLALPLRAAGEVTRAALAEIQGGENGDMPTSPVESTRARYVRAVDPLAREALETCARGRWNCAVDPDLAVRVSNALRLALGQLSVEVPLVVSPTESSKPSVSFEGVLEHALGKLGEVGSILRRPIDAIKHQAKTVTVGTSRDDTTARRPHGALASALAEADVSTESLAGSDQAALAALGPAIARVRGVTIYAVTGLDPLGAPTAEARIQVLKKTGVAKGLRSRADHGSELMGTKRKVVSSPRVHVYRSERDQQPLVVCPIYEHGLVRGLGLLHVEVVRDLDLRGRIQVLKAASRYEDLRCAVTEVTPSWDDGILDALPMEELVTAPVELLARAVLLIAKRRAVEQKAEAPTNGSSQKGEVRR